MLGLQQLWSDTKFIHIRRLKAYIVLTFFDSFRNKSRKPQPIRTKVGTVHMPRSRADNVHEILGAISKVEAKWGAKKCPGRVIFCQQYHTTFRQLHNGRFSLNLATTRESWVKRRIRTAIYEKIPLRGHLPPKLQTWRGSNRHLTQSRLQVKGCTAERYCLLRVVAQGPGSFQGLNFSLRRTVVALRGVKIAQLSDFGLFSPYKTRKKYLPMTSLQPVSPGVTLQNDSDFSV